MKYKIGVMGKAGRSRQLPEKIIKSGEIVGREIAKNNCILITGACMGVPDIAARAASKKKGLILGYSPVENLKKHLEPPISYPYPPENMELIFTGQGKVGRNVLSVTECDGILFIGGGTGTLNEFTIAYHNHKIIGILLGVEGVTEKILGMEKKLEEGSGKKKSAVIVKDRDPKKLVRKVIEKIEEKKETKRKEAPITFKNKNNKELMGVLHLPAREKPPLVIICHGFQNTKTDKKLIKLGRAVCEEGIAAFRFDFEGCGDSEGDAQEITVEGQACDLDSAVQAIQEEIDLDMKKVAFVGASLGSVIISLFLKEKKGMAKTAVFWSQGFNQKSLFKKWHATEEKEEMKDKGVIYKKDKEIGKDYYLENKDKDYSFALSQLRLPILIMHGKKDEDVPLEFSEKLEKKHKNVSLTVLPKGNHKFNDYKSQERLIKETVRWLKKHLN